MVYIYSGIYRAIKKNEIVILARKWTQLEILKRKKIMHVFS